jgi:hypothetical protein
LQCSSEATSPVWVRQKTPTWLADLVPERKLKPLHQSRSVYMASTRRIAFCRSPPMKVAVRTPQRGKLFYVHQDLVTKRSEYSKDLFVRPYSGRTYESLFIGAKKNRAQLLLLGKGSPASLWDAASSSRRWVCLSVSLDISITSSTPTNSVEKYCPHTSAAARQPWSSAGFLPQVPVTPCAPTGFRFGAEPRSSARGGDISCEFASVATFNSGC